MTVPLVRELAPSDYPLAARVWYHYHQQTADPAIDRVFGVFDDGTLTTVARCRRHADGLEVDGVFTLEEYRGRGLARLAVQALIDACGHETLYLHSTLELIGFYRSFGFVPIPEKELPPTIRERLIFCFGEMWGCNAAPMRQTKGSVFILSARKGNRRSIFRNHGLWHGGSPWQFPGDSAP